MQANGMVVAGKTNVVLAVNTSVCVVVGIRLLTVTAVVLDVLLDVLDDEELSPLHIRNLRSFPKFFSFESNCRKRTGFVSFFSLPLFIRR